MIYRWTYDDDQQFPLLYAMTSSFRSWCSSSSWWWSFTIASVVYDIVFADADIDDVDDANIYIVNADDDSRRIPLFVKGEC